KIVFINGGSARGAMVIYEDYLSDKNIVFTRLLGDGTTLKPAYPNNLYPVCRQSNDQQNPKAVKSGTGEVLVAWQDDRKSVAGSATTSIYAQRINRTPRRLIGPSPSVSSWGEPITNRSG